MTTKCAEKKKKNYMVSHYGVCLVVGVWFGFDQLSLPGVRKTCL